jgi:hypothetical protein
MAKQLTEQELRQQAVRALSDSLGPVDALRFLALVSREPFDYQRWRKEYFPHYSVDELLTEVRNHITAYFTSQISRRLIRWQKGRP